LSHGLLLALRDELLSAVDVVGRPGEGGVGHDVNRESGDVAGADDAPDGQRGPQLGPSSLELIAEQRCRQRRIDEAGSEQDGPDRRELEGKGGNERGSAAMAAEAIPGRERSAARRYRP
jgi:hypothetical protein